MNIYVLAELDSSGEDTFVVYKDNAAALNDFLKRENSLRKHYGYYTPDYPLTKVYEDMVQTSPGIRLGVRVVKVTTEAPVYHLVVGFDKHDNIVYISAHATREEADMELIRITRHYAVKYKDDKFLKQTRAEILFNETVVKNGTDYIVFETFKAEGVNYGTEN